MRSSTAACVLAAVMLGACDRPSTPATDSGKSAAIHAAAADTGIGAKRSDWASLERQLPNDPAAAAALLERFREANGLPLEFDIPDNAPAAKTRSLDVIDDDLAGKSAIVFVQRMPDSTSILGTAPVIEFDSTGRIIRRWNIPRDVEFWMDVVEGAVGDELITAYRSVRANVHLRFRPDGSYRVSAESPPPLEPEKWIDAGGSTYVQVIPSGGVQWSQHAPGVPGVEPGHWIPSGDSGWYMRTDTLPGLPTRARAITLNQPPKPNGITCPPSKEFEGMLCSSFPGEHGRRRLAYPMTTT